MDENEIQRLREEFKGMQLIGSDYQAALLLSNTLQAHNASKLYNQRLLEAPPKKELLPKEHLLAFIQKYKAVPGLINFAGIMMTTLYTHHELSDTQVIQVASEINKAAKDFPPSEYFQYTAVYFQGGQEEVRTQVFRGEAHKQFMQAYQRKDWEAVRQISRARPNELFEFIVRETQRVGLENCIVVGLPPGQVR